MTEHVTTGSQILQRCGTQPQRSSKGPCQLESLWKKPSPGLRIHCAPAKLTRSLRGPEEEDVGKTLCLEGPGFKASLVCVGGRSFSCSESEAVISCSLVRAEPRAVSARLSPCSPKPPERRTRATCASPVTMDVLASCCGFCPVPLKIASARRLIVASSYLLESHEHNELSF